MTFHFHPFFLPLSLLQPLRECSHPGVCTHDLHTVVSARLAHSQCKATSALHFYLHCPGSACIMGLHKATTGSCSI
jgi:hypothetical protein